MSHSPWERLQRGQRLFGSWQGLGLLEKGREGKGAEDGGKSYELHPGKSALNADSLSDHYFNRMYHCPHFINGETEAWKWGSTSQAMQTVLEVARHVFSLRYA